MKKIFYSTFLILTSTPFALLAQPALHFAALGQSVIEDHENSQENFGVFRTMESMSFDEDRKSMAVKIDIEQPICEGQAGVLSLINPSGLDWTYKVLSKQGAFVAEGKVGYNRRIGELNPGSFFIQFTLPDGSSAMDEFRVKEAEGLSASLEPHPDNSYVCGNEVVFTGISAGASEFTWDMGDGSRPISGSSTVHHTYAKPGNYEVTFTVNNWDCQEAVKYNVSINGPIAFEEGEY